MNHLLLFLLISISFYQIGNSQSVYSALQLGKSPTVRVLIGIQPNVTLSIPKNALIITSNGRHELDKELVFEINFSKERIRLKSRSGSIFSSVDSIQFFIPDSSLFLIDQSPYRGNLVLIKTEAELLIVNPVSLENYLWSVVPSEIGNGRKENEIEAVKAQSVAARTYSLIKLLSKKTNPHFDLSATFMDQVYLGVKAEIASYIPHLKSTEGIIAIHDTLLIQSLFHSACGGLTARVDQTWGQTTPISYLTSVYCGNDSVQFCSISPFAQWKKTIPIRYHNKKIFDHSLQYVEKNPNHVFYNQKQLVNFSISHRDSSGRVIKALLTSRSGSVTANGDYIRWILPDSTGQILPSNWFTIMGTKRNEHGLTSIEIEGRGYGHGLGLCQWGSIHMSRLGYTFDQILRFYYRGIRLVDMYK